MSEEPKKRTIEVDEEFLEQLYGLVGKIPPGEKNINVDLLKDLILDIKRKIDRAKTEAIEELHSPKKNSENSAITDEYSDEENPKSVIDGIANAIPMKRLGTIEELGNLAAFLASDESSYITAQGIVIDGASTLPETMTMGV